MPRGTVDVLRHGIDEQNVKGIRLASFRPAHGLTPELEERYLANELVVTRQVAYEPGSNKTLDLMLEVNGIPVKSRSQAIDVGTKQYKGGEREFRVRIMTMGRIEERTYTAPDDDR